MTTTPTTTDTGGQAFPNAHPTCPGDGMTLLDYYAGEAMKELVGCAARNEVDDYTPAAVASDAFNQAVAMIAEKRRRESSSC